MDSQTSGALPATPKTSHEYAKRLHEIADFLLSRPEFKTHDQAYLLQHYYDKEGFLAAVRALGSGKKGTQFEGTSYVDTTFTPNAALELIISIPKNKMCVLVRPAEYECDPFLSPDEEKNLGGAA